MYWVGIRKSEIESCRNLFDGSITFLGDGKDNNLSLEKSLGRKIDYNDPANSYTLGKWLNQQCLSIIRQSPNQKLCWYNQNYAHYRFDGILENSICVNPKEILNFLNDKIVSKTFFKKYCLPFEVQSFKNVRYKDRPLVVQEKLSQGGSGTFLLQPAKDKLPIQPDSKVLVSEYQRDCTPANMHMIIGDKINTLLPASIQEISIDSTFDYQSGNYDKYANLPSSAKDGFSKTANEIAAILQKLGYRGVCGLDMILVGNRWYFMEINPRFQRSTEKLNEILISKGQKTVQEQNLLAFR